MRRRSTIEEITSGRLQSKNSGDNLSNETNGANIHATSQPELSKWRITTSIVLCALATLFDGISNSLTGPFFPEKANEKGK